MQKIASISLDLGDHLLKYLWIKGVNRLIPEGKNGAGENSWIFVDEVIVE